MFRFQRRTCLPGPNTWKTCDDNTLMKKRLAKGYVQVYTGDGKGKTSAALGLALRAVGAGLKVLIAQFGKGTPSSELAALESFGDRVQVRRYGRGRFIERRPAPEDIEAARAGLAEVKGLIVSDRFDVVILDEANIAVFFGLLSIDDLLELIDLKPGHVELLITGRKAHPRLVERADLVTEMRKVKHYFDRGIQARKGIEE